MKAWSCLLALALAGCLTATEPIAQPGRVLHSDDFRNGLGQWVVEQQPGGTVTTEDGRIVITDQGGCTVWFKPRLTAPVVITYTVRMSSKARVSDLNCFWMASNPARPDDLFAAGHGRTGKFATYDTLRTYYVGYGGNANTTTRFRRYDGTGARPLAPEHDLSGAAYLLKPDHAYRIMLIATADGRVQYVRDGTVIFDVRDPQPLTSGWFGFRTVLSQMEVTDFRVFEPGK
jgi:hypothetical protein